MATIGMLVDEFRYDESILLNGLRKAARAMPKRPPIACKCGGIRRNDKCDRCGKGYGKRRATANERGYGADWRKARRLFLKDHPFCVKCSAASVVVDHVEPHRGDMVKFWMRSNWQALCVKCHNTKTGSGR